MLEYYLEEMSKQGSQLLLWVVAAGAIILGIISIGIVGAVIYAALAYDRVPDVLVNWGGLIVGFFIGNFFNFIRSALDVAQRSEGDAGEANKGATESI